MVEGDNSRERERERDNHRERDRDTDRPITQIFVGGVTSNIRQEDLEDAFKEFGEIKEVTVKRDFAFVDFKDPESARKAVDGFQGKQI